MFWHLEKKSRVSHWSRGVCFIFKHVHNADQMSTDQKYCRRFLPSGGSAQESANGKRSQAMLRGRTSTCSIRKHKNLKIGSFCVFSRTTKIPASGTWRMWQLLEHWCRREIRTVLPFSPTTSPCSGRWCSLRTCSPCPVCSSRVSHWWCFGCRRKDQIALP